MKQLVSGEKKKKYQKYQENPKHPGNPEHRGTQKLQYKNRQEKETRSTAVLVAPPSRMVSSAHTHT